MAPVRGHPVHKAKPHQQHNNSMKDKATPAPRRKTINTKALFQTGTIAARKRHAGDRRSEQVFKSPYLSNLGTSILKSRFLSSPPKPKPKPKPHPLVLGLNDSTADYRKVLDGLVANNLDPIHQDLVTRLKQGSCHAEVDGQPASELATAFKLASEAGQLFSAPLHNITYTACFKGSKKAVTLSLGEAVAGFKTKLKEKTTELQQLWLEWEQVRQDIAQTGADLLGEELLAHLPTTGVTQHATAEPSIQARLENLRADVRNAIQTMHADVAAEEATTTKEREKAEKSFNGFMRGRE